MSSTARVSGRLGVLVAVAVLGLGAGTATAAIPGAPTTKGRTSPSWVFDTSKAQACRMVVYPAGGRAGAAAPSRDVYAFVLVVTRRVGMSCGAARSIAKTTWSKGRGGGLRWRRDHGWTSTQTAASAFQFTGRSGGRRLTFQALR